MAIQFASGATTRCPACKTENVLLKEVGSLMICDKCSSKRFSAKVRKSIQDAYERQLEQKRKEQWRARMEVARKGVALFDQGKVKEALKYFHDYISILESRHNVGQGNLHPSMFKTNEEKGEMILIAGVYWDLAKIYDHMKGHRPDLKVALNKFLEFSMDRPHVVLSAEAIRKYLQNKGAMHPEDFKQVQLLLRKNMTRCFVSTAVFGPSSVETRFLQNFRDEYLIKKIWGRAFVWIYYKISPPIARVALRSNTINLFFKMVLTRIIYWLK